MFMNVSLTFDDIRGTVNESPSRCHWTTRNPHQIWLAATTWKSFLPHKYAYGFWATLSYIPLCLRPSVSALSWRVYLHARILHLSTPFWICECDNFKKSGWLFQVSRGNASMRRPWLCPFKAWKFESMTSAIPVQCSTNWAIKPTGSWPFLWVRNIPVEDQEYKWKWPAPSWLNSSVGRALHRYRRGHGFESRSGLNCFQALISQLLKLSV